MEKTLSRSDARVSLVVPVLNAADHLPQLLPAVLGQKGVALEEIVLVDSGSSDGSRSIAAGFEKTRVVQIENFSHGRARNLGVSETKGDTIAFLSQDALPLGKDWLRALVEPLAQDGVAASFSRQIPREDANPMERFFLQTHFPPGDDLVMRKAEGETPAFQREVFLSNVSSAMPRDILERFPFDEEIIMSEDQQFARDVIEDGMVIVYTPSSAVLHSHNYSLKTVFQRYFDSIYSLTKLFSGHRVENSAAMAVRYLTRELGYIARNHPLWLPYYCLYTLAKSAGAFLGHYAERMPRGLARRLSLHKYYWDDLD